MHRDRYAAARAEGFRSGLEVVLAKQLDKAGVPYEYEGITLNYLQPEESRKYSPDFILPNGIIVEGKGQWDTADRKKMKLVLKQHPLIDIRMVFNRSLSRISKRSTTTYADYCKTLGIKFADKLIPASWLTEPVNQASLDAIKAIQSRAN